MLTGDATAVERRSGDDTGGIQPAGPSGMRVVRIEASRGWEALDLRELWKYRELVWFLVWRDVKVRYRQTFLGVAWAVVQPVVTMVVFTVIFGRVANLPSDGIPYPVFTYAALLPWTLFSSALTSSSNSIVGSAGLVSKVYFPRLVVPIASVAATLVDFCISFIVFLVLMGWYDLTPGLACLLLPLLVVVTLGTALAVGLWASALNVRYRDVQHLMPFVAQFLMFASPVAYSASLITSPGWRTIYGMNPMAGIIQTFRWALIGAAPPSVSMLPGILVAGALLVGGLFFFRRTEASFADVI
ncbi:MAG: ABC transporter permease [Acidobacteriota bacterium]